MQGISGRKKPTPKCNTNTSKATYDLGYMAAEYGRVVVQLIHNHQLQVLQESENRARHYGKYIDSFRLTFARYLHEAV